MLRAPAPADDGNEFEGSERAVSADTDQGAEERTDVSIRTIGKLNKALPIVVLSVLCAAIVLSRLHTYEEPLERDLTTYAVIAHEMLAGKALYRDLWDHKPPAIHVTYAAAELIAGYGRDSIFLMNVAAAIATLFACYWACSAGGGGRIGGCFAAALFAFASGGLAIKGNQPNTEVFINACLATGFAILVRTGERSLGVRNAIAGRATLCCRIALQTDCRRASGPACRRLLRLLSSKLAQESNCGWGHHRHDRLGQLGFGAGLFFFARQRERVYRSRIHI